MSVTVTCVTTTRPRSTTRRRWPRTIRRRRSTCWPTTPTSTAARSTDRLGDPAGQRHGGDHRRRRRADLRAGPGLLQHPPGTTPDTFTYTLAPGGSTATVSVTVTCVDDPPVAVERHGDGGRGRSGAPRSTCWPTTPTRRRADHDRLGDPAGQRHGGDHRRRDRPDLPAGPELLQRPAGHHPGHVHLHAHPGGSTATVSVTVTCVDDPPVAVDDAATVAEDDPATRDRRAGQRHRRRRRSDHDRSVTQPANGTVVITDGGTGLTYQPDRELLQHPAGGVTRTRSPTRSPRRLDRDGVGDGDLCRRPADGGRTTRRRWPRTTRRRRSTCWPTTPTPTAVRSRSTR